jgi:hypothetical protein
MVRTPRICFLCLKEFLKKNTQASDRQKLEAKSRLLDLVFTNDLNKLLSTSQYFPLGKILK